MQRGHGKPSPPARQTHRKANPLNLSRESGQRTRKKQLVAAQGLAVVKGVKRETCVSLGKGNKEAFALVGDAGIAG